MPSMVEFPKIFPLTLILCPRKGINEIKIIIYLWRNLGYRAAIKGAFSRSQAEPGNESYYRQAKLGTYLRSQVQLGNELKNVIPGPACTFGCGTGQKNERGTEFIKSIHVFSIGYIVRSPLVRRDRAILSHDCVAGVPCSGAPVPRSIAAVAGSGEVVPGRERGKSRPRA
jgi:hypothetical protein